MQLEQFYTGACWERALIACFIATLTLYILLRALTLLWWGRKLARLSASFPALVATLEKSCMHFAGQTALKKFERKASVSGAVTGLALASMVCALLYGATRRR